jgi:hypothetical protein
MGRQGIIINIGKKGIGQIFSLFSTGFLDLNYLVGLNNYENDVSLSLKKWRRGLNALSPFQNEQKENYFFSVDLVVVEVVSEEGVPSAGVVVVVELEPGAIVLLPSAGAVVVVEVEEPGAAVPSAGAVVVVFVVVSSVFFSPLQAAKPSIRAPRLAKVPTCFK